MKLNDTVIFKNKITCKNRFALAPLTNTQSNEDGTISQDEINWLLRRASGNFGMLITCASHVTKSGQGWKNQLGIYSDHHIEGLTNLVSQLKKYDNLNIIQLYHGGARSPSALTGIPPLSASSFMLNVPDFEQPIPATHQDIATITEAFVAATKRAIKAGFDGVEIHGANGYLFTQFISKATNMRNDEYGGCLKNRAKLLIDTLKECRKIAPKNFIIGVRISPENINGQIGLDLEENVQIAKYLEENGADYIHLSMINALKKSEHEHKKSIVQMFKNILSQDTVLIVAGGIDNHKKANELINIGADMVSIGTVAIANPDFPIRVINEQDKYSPTLLPYTKAHLKDMMVSDSFINYLEIRPGFIRN